MNTAFDRWSSALAFFSDSVVQAVLGVVAILIVSGVALYALSKLRDSNTDNQQLDEVLRKNFEEMRSEGDIDDQEFRKIKALLSGGRVPLPKTATNPPSPTNSPSQEIDADPSGNL